MASAGASGDPSPLSDLEIRWREHLPGEGFEDYVAFHGKAYVGRVYKRLAAGFNQNLWQWNTAWGGSPRMGLCPSQREAMLELETRYEKRLAEGKGARP